jgi:hypothetical protein
LCLTIQAEEERESLYKLVPESLNFGFINFNEPRRRRHRLREAKSVCNFCGETHREEKISQLLRTFCARERERWGGGVNYVRLMAHGNKSFALSETTNCLVSENHCHLTLGGNFLKAD